MLHIAGGKVEKETDTDSPLDSDGKVGKQFTTDGAVGEYNHRLVD